MLYLIRVFRTPVPIQSQRNAVLTFQNYIFKIHINIVLTSMAIICKKSLLFRIAFQSSKGTWHPQYNTKQEIVKCNFSIFILWWQ